MLADLVRPWGVEARVTHDRGVPPVSNSADSVEVLAAAVRGVLGRDNLDPTAQSLGGEDFAWYLEKVPGALARLGTRTPGGRTYDLHMGDLMIDERAIGIGASVLAAACVQRDLLRSERAASIGARDTRPDVTPASIRHIRVDFITVHGPGPQERPGGVPRGYGPSRTATTLSPRTPRGAPGPAPEPKEPS